MPSKLATLEDPTAWYRPDGDGYVLLDPTSREPINPNTIPSWLASDPVLNRAIGFLASRGADVHITILYGLHGYAEDLDGIEGGFEDLVRRSDYFGFEHWGLTESQQSLRESPRRTVNPDELLNFDTFLERYGHRFSSTFDARIDYARLIGGTAGFVVDMPRDSHLAVERAAYRQRKALERLDAPESGVLFGATQMVREWSMVARLAWELWRQEGGSENSMDVVLAMGPLHQDLTRKFEGLGSLVTSLSVGPEQFPDDDMMHLARVLASGKVSRQGAETLSEIARSIDTTE